jgi:hypothetical protein
MGELQQDDFEDGMGWTQIADRTFENVLLLWREFYLDFSPVKLVA